MLNDSKLDFGCEPDSTFGGISIFFDPTPGFGFYSTYLKRSLDVIIVLISLPLVVVVIALLAPVLLADGGPVFFVQDRVGRGGRVFLMWKLRTMVADAEGRLAAHLAADPAAKAEWEETQKLRNDPRTTAFGRILRRTSIDELPQLWNVLRGDMSLVGPRPMMPCQCAIYPGQCYYRLRPGVTGLWQVSARNETSFAHRADFDSRYAECLSLATDFLILVRTIRPVICGTGH
jgi:lipopolysaccharide/colanic/teichoic acid biosynthesis glycosyltransferase